MMIATTIDSLNSCIDELNRQIENIRECCPHEELYTVVHHNEEGEPYIECKCVDCGKWWTDKLEEMEEESD